MALVDELHRRREGLIAYLKLKVDEHDWYGVQDAARDLREVDATLREVDATLRQLLDGMKVQA